MSKHDKKDWNKFHEENKDQIELEEPSVLKESALEHPDYAQLEDKLTLAEQEAHANWEKAMRATAELDNVRRRAEQEVAKAHRYGLEKIISSLLPVLDSMEQALQLAININDEAMREGLELTTKLFVDVLGKNGVTQLDPMGAQFDPHQHEAMSIQDQPGTPPNTVLAVFQKGYKLNDRIIRPARVIVSKD